MTTNAPGQPDGPFEPTHSTPLTPDDGRCAELERALGQLPWREPGAGLDARVAAAVAGAMPGDRLVLPWARRWLSAAAVLVLAAGVGLAVVMLTTTGPGPMTVADGQGVVDQPPMLAAVAPPVAEHTPRIEQVWVTSEPTGRIVLTNGRAMEAVRVTAVRHVSFEDEDGVAYDMAFPVEQVMYVPASFE